MDINHTFQRREFLTRAGGFAALSILGTAGVAADNPLKPARRVVTGVNSSGKSVVVSDGPVSESARYSTPGEGKGIGCDLWVEKAVPVDISDQSDPIDDYAVQMWPPPGGVIVRMITWQPGVSFSMHRSNTIDFVFIISGQLELILEDGSTVLGPGDCLVQRSTNHAWRVVGTEPCTFAGVLLSAEDRE